MRLINRAEFSTVISSKQAAVVHFDAPWNMYRAGVRQAMLDAEHAFGDRVTFAEVDCDVEGELSRSFPVPNVPFLAYFLNGRYMGGKVGALPDIARQLQRVLRGERIE
jgi:thioredoxin-like negative regulator of GroEL